MAFAEAESWFAVHLRGTQELFVGGGIELGSSCRAVNRGMHETGLGSHLAIHPPPKVHGLIRGWDSRAFCSHWEGCLASHRP